MWSCVAINVVAKVAEFLSGKADHRRASVRHWRITLDVTCVSRELRRADGNRLLRRDRGATFNAPCASVQAPAGFLAAPRAPWPMLGTGCMPSLAVREAGGNGASLSATCFIERARFAFDMRPLRESATSRRAVSLFARLTAAARRVRLALVPTSCDAASAGRAVWPRNSRRRDLPMSRSLSRATRKVMTRSSRAPSDSCFTAGWRVCETISCSLFERLGIPFTPV